MVQSGPRGRRPARLLVRGLVPALAIALLVLLGGASPAATPAEPTVARAPRVLVIGDSTTVQMRAPFAAALRARGLAATIDALSGRTTREGRAVVARYDLARYDHVVVLLGANGKRANALRDMRALRALGVDTMATVQAPRQKVVNRAVTAVFGKQRITWAGYAKKRGITTTDRKHYSRAAYRVRATYLAREIAERATAALER